MGYAWNITSNQVKYGKNCAGNNVKKQGRRQCEAGEPEIPAYECWEKVQFAFHYSLTWRHTGISKEFGSTVWKVTAGVQQYGLMEQIQCYPWTAS